jgi:ATP-dependent Clp protease ATP-binding subunit ClpB
MTSPKRFALATEQVMTALRGHFKPEFLNRIDDIVVFRPLGAEQLTKIVDLRLQDVRNLLTGRKITLELSDAAKHTLFTSGYDPAYGARPLKRAIQRLIQDPLAMKILDGDVLHGDHVLVDSADGKLSFEVHHGEAEAAAKTEEAVRPG